MRTLFVRLGGRTIVSTVAEEDLNRVLEDLGPHVCEIATRPSRGHRSVREELMFRTRSRREHLKFRVVS